MLSTVSYKFNMRRCSASSRARNRGGRRLLAAADAIPAVGTDLKVTPPAKHEPCKSFSRTGPHVMSRAAACYPSYALHYPSSHVRVSYSYVRTPSMPPEVR